MKHPALLQIHHEVRKQSRYWITALFWTLLGTVIGILICARFHGL